MAVKIVKDCLLLDRKFSPEEYARYQAQIEARKSFGYYQQIAIQDAAGKRLTTPGTHPGVAVLANLDQHGFPHDFTGKTVLDIGCNAGFYSFVTLIRGARSVVGIDSTVHYVEQARLLNEILGLDVEFREDDGHRLDERFGSFDVVLNTGVIYHLQNPMDFLTRMARMTRQTMYLETEMLTDPKYSEYAWFIEKEYCGDRSNWWIYGPQCVERMVRAAGFPHVEFQGFVWTPPRGMKTPEGYDRQGRGAFVCWK
jgi:2-polyprenyl-3-methyl-5-hydroxy-6-metoxy-1,4-benzoquinol methylase